MQPRKRLHCLRGKPTCRRSGLSMRGVGLRAFQRALMRGSPVNPQASPHTAFSR